MATSGSVDYSRTATQIIIRAMRLIGATEGGEVPTAAESADALETLEMMVKAWQAEGIHLWAETEGILWFVKGTARYALGPGGDHAASNYVRTTTSLAATSGASSIEVASIAGIANLDNIGIVQDDGTIHWTTVNGAPAGSTVTLATVLTADVALGKQVWAYTTKIERPLKISNVRRRDRALQDIPIWTVSRSEYFGTPNKTTQSPPVNIYYDPQLTNGQIYVWPAPDSVENVLLFTFRRSIEDFDNLTNTPDFPQEWLEALTWNLADRLVPEYEVPETKVAKVEKKALESKAKMEVWDSEFESIYFQPDPHYGQ